jgi:hypothetical protein
VEHEALRKSDGELERMIGSPTPDSDTFPTSADFARWLASLRQERGEEWVQRHRGLLQEQYEALRDF